MYIINLELYTYNENNTMIKKTYNVEQFINDMQDFAANSSNYNGYSRDALTEMYHYMTDMGAGEVEFDPISFHCSFSELSLSDIKKDYNDIETLEDLQEKTWAVKLDNDMILFDYNF